MLLRRPGLGGLIVGLLILRFAPEARGEGIPALMETLHKKGGRIRPRTGPAILLASAVTIGSGGSAGRESPIAQIGASFGSLLGQRLRLNVTEVQILAVSGFVAGLAGTFNAPLGSAIFGMEVVMRRFRMVDAVPILLSAVVGAATASAFLGQNPAFTPVWTEITLPELILCFFLGLIFGGLAVLWGRLLSGAERLFEWIPLSEGLKPGLGGLVAGAAGLYFIGYGVMGVGYDGITRIFEMHDLPASADMVIFLIVLGLVKIAATSFSVGSGGSGGIFAPSLYIGFMFGVAFGLLADMALPGLGAASPEVYGLWGMAALFAGAGRAPLTCIVMIPEMASSYDRLPPVIIACVLSYATTQFLMKGRSIYSIKLGKKGIFIDQPQPVLKGITVGEAMARDVVAVGEETTLRELRDLVFRTNHTGFPVVKDGELVGIVTFDDFRNVSVEEQDGSTVGDVAERAVVTVRPDQSTKIAMDLMYQHQIGRIPVVSGDDPKRLVGMITRTDVIRAYEGEVER
jgi:CIC family chloride channel protein